MDKALDSKVVSVHLDATTEGGVTMQAAGPFATESHREEQQLPALSDSKRENVTEFTNRQDFLAMDSLHEVEKSIERAETSLCETRPADEGRQAINQVRSFLQTINDEAKKEAQKSVEALREGSTDKIMINQTERFNTNV